MYAVFYGFAFWVAGEVLGVHEKRSSRSWRFRVAVCTLAAVGACLGLLLMVWAIEYRFVGRFALAKIVGCSVAGVMIMRLAIEGMASRSRPKVLALLTEETSKELATALKDSGEQLQLEGFKEDVPDSAEGLVGYCEELGIHEVVTQRDTEHKGLLNVVGLLAGGTRVSDIVDFWERMFARIPPQYVDEAWLARLDLRLRHPLFHRAKRLLDILVAIIGLVVSIPILAIASVLILVDSRGSIFFSQRRTGYLGSDYVLYKLRTMRTDAEEDGAQWAAKKDVRVTGVGRFLRKWRIDEIPQFWNVLRGEMSIVGPRPERPELEEKLAVEIPFWSSRHLVKPGLTGWAQIRFRYAADSNASREKLAHDLYYIKNASLLLDLQIILSTLRSLARGSR
jgi:exopolysaccharide biosynthesis polyprenyl glycosylphosphotransferase